MFKFTSHFVLILVLITPTITFLNHKGFAYAEEDAVEDEVVMEDDDEGEVEDEDDEGIVEDEAEGGDSAAPSATEDEEEAEAITAHKDAETAVLFESGAEPQLIAGKKASAYIHFANRGSDNFIITSIDGSFRYPQDFSYVIQNFTVINPDKMIDAGYEGSFRYNMFAGELSGGRSFGLIINVNYKDTEDNMYRDAVFNQTIQVLENEEGVDAETFFMYLMLVALGALTVVGIYHGMGGKGKRSRKRTTAAPNAQGSGLETGTTNGPVDFSWIPEETLKAMNKGTPSPRRSPRKRANKKTTTSNKEQ